MSQLKEKLGAWLKVARLQFHPMACIAYSMGAAAASATSQKFDLSVYAVGYAVIFLVEVCTIFCNEYYDFGTDRLNENFSIFTGGTRVLVEGKLSFKELKTGIFIVALLITMMSSLLIRIDGDVSPSLLISFLVLGLFLGIGYTVPPLKFSYRGMGELVVGTTHSFYLVLSGYVFQTGIWQNSLPWLLSIPLFFAVLAANTLAGIPDRVADEAVSKRSISVVFGSRRATVLAAVCLLVAAFAGTALWYFSIIGGPLSLLILVAIPHGMLLLRALLELMRAEKYDRRIDRIMGMALSYIIWFGLVPLISLIWS